MPDVAITNIRRTLAVAREETVLHAALAAGIAYPHGCKSGRCGSCKSRLIQGEIELLEHSRFALSPEERAAGLVLACRALPKADISIGWLDTSDDRADHPLRRDVAEVVSATKATHDILVLRLRPAGEPMIFSAGQYATLTVPGVPPRDYSMANRPGGADLEFHIRRVPGGAASVAMHDLAPGDQVQIEGPRGAAHLRPNHAGPILAVAGGSGLAPVLSILRTGIALPMRQPVRVYFGARSERDLYGLDILHDLARSHADMIVTPVLSEPDGTTSRRTGHVHDAVAADIIDLDGWKCYAAGPPAMIDALTEAALAAGLRQEDLHADSFFTPDAASASDRKRA